MHRSPGTTTPAPVRPIPLARFPAVAAVTSDRRVTVRLGALALLLYLPGIWWGLPHATAPDRIRPWGSDELAPLGPIAELYSVFIASSPEFNPQYPLLQYLVQALLFVPYLLWLRLTGGLGAPSVEFPYGLADPVTSLATMTLLARVPSLFMGAGVVVAGYLTGRILWGRRAGILAGVLVLLLPPMAYYSRTSNVDMGALFWTSLGLLVVARVVRGGLTTRRAVWIGVFAALATATKDPSYAAFAAVSPALLPAHIRRLRREDSDWKRVAAAPGLGLLAATAVYVVASGLVFDLARYRAHVRFILHGSPEGRGVFYDSAPATLTGYLATLGETAHQVTAAMGLPAALVAVAGLIVCARRTPRLLVLFLPALGIIAGVILPVRFVQLRFVLPIIYVLCLFAGCALAAGIESRRRWIRSTVALVVATTGAWGLLRTADLTIQMLGDSRYALSAWMREHARPGDRVAYDGAAMKLPALDAGIVTLPFPTSPDELRGARTDTPEFVIIIPQQQFEPVHAWTLPGEVYRRLQDGSLGYRQVYAAQGLYLLSPRPVSFVNPPVRVFARHDLLEQSRRLRVQVELLD